MAEITAKAHRGMKFVEDNAMALAFIYQLTRKDVAFATSSGKWTNFTATQKIEDFVNMITGRTLGETFFPAVSNYPQVFNISQAWNPTTQVGLLLWAIHQLGFASNRIGTLGARIATGGALGGIFDAPISTSQNIQGVIPTGNYSPQVRNGLPVADKGPWTT